MPYHWERKRCAILKSVADHKLARQPSYKVALEALQATARVEHLANESRLEKWDLVKLAYEIDQLETKKKGSGTKMAGSLKKSIKSAERELHEAVSAYNLKVDASENTTVTAIFKLAREGDVSASKCAYWVVCSASPITNQANQVQKPS